MTMASAPAAAAAAAAAQIKLWNLGAMEVKVSDKLQVK
jgi:hypothetical protein